MNEMIEKWLKNKVEYFGDKFDFSFIFSLAIAEDRIDVLEWYVNLCIENGINETFLLNGLLFLTAPCDCIEIIKWLKKRNVNLNVKYMNESASMFMFLFENHCKIIEYITNLGGDAIIQNQSLVLNMASLTSTGTYLKDHMECTPLYFAAVSGRIDNIKLLISLGANIDERNVAGRTPLYITAGTNQIESIKCLVSLGAKVDEVDNTGFTSLSMAATSGQIESMKCLVSLGADVNAKTKDGFTPMFLAVSSGNIESMNCLKSLGADINAKTNDGKTLLDVAKNLGDIPDVVAWLEANGVQK